MSYPRPPTPNWDLLKATATYAGLILLDRVAYVVLSEYASGARRQQGSMTKTGHAHARRAFGGGAWAYRSPATVSRHLHLRLAKLPTAIQAIRWQA